MKKHSPKRPYEFYFQKCQQLNLLANKKVRRWLKLYEFGMLNNRDRRDFDEYIAKSEREMMTKGLITPNPSPEQALSGSYLIGHIEDEKTTIPVGISFSPPRPIAITGSSGVGKTMATGTLTESIRDEAPIIILDPRGDYEYIARIHPDDTLVVNAEDFPLNPFVADDGVNEDEHLRSTVSAIADALTMYHRSVTVLLEACLLLIRGKQVPTLGKLAEFLKQNETLFKGNKSAYDSVLDRLLALEQIFNHSWNVDHGLSVRSLTKFKTVVIRTGGLGRTDIRVMYAALILVRVYLYLKSQGERPSKPKIVVVFEEAEYLLSKHRESGAYSVSVVVEFTHLARAVGLQLIFVTQDPSAISGQVLNDCGNFFAFSHRGGTATEYVARTLTLPREAIPQIANLPAQHCYLRPNSGEYQQPFLIKTLDFPHDTKPLTPTERACHEKQTSRFLSSFPNNKGGDQAKASNFGCSLNSQKPQSLPVPVPGSPSGSFFSWVRSLYGSSPRTIESDPGGSNPQPASSEKQSEPADSSGKDVPERLPYDMEHFLHSVAGVGEKGHTAVYEHAGISDPTGKKRVEKGKDDGLLLSHTIRPPGRSGQRKTLFLTEKARDLLRVPKGKGVGGIDHTAYQREFSYALTELGFDARIEKSHNQKSVDILCKFQDSKNETHYHAIEIEESTDGISNIKRDLAAGFDEVFVIIRLRRQATLEAKIKETFSEEERKRIHVTSPGTFLQEYVNRHKRR